MSDTPEHDTLYLAGKGVITAALIGIGYVSGASLPLLAPLAGAVGGNWLSNMCERGFESYRNSWLTSVGALNHHLSRALQQAFTDTVRYLRTAWSRSSAYAALTREEQQQSKQALTWLAEDAPRLLDTALLEATAQQGLLPVVQATPDDPYAPFRSPTPARPPNICYPCGQQPHHVAHERQGRYDPLTSRPDVLFTINARISPVLPAPDHIGP